MDKPTPNKLPKEWAKFEEKTEARVRNDLAMNRYGEFEKAQAEHWLAYKSSERLSATNSQQTAEAARAAAAAERAAEAAERAAAAAEEQATQAQRANRIAAIALIIAIAACIMSLIALARKIS